MTAPADSRISDERLGELLADLSPNNVMRRKDLDGILSALTELRERRAQTAAVKPLSNEKFTLEELDQLFAGKIPLLVMKLLFPEQSADLTVGELRQIVRALSADPPPAQAAGVTPTHRHKKRGTEYVLIGYGRVQAENWREKQVEDGILHYAPVDMREVAIYRSVDDGSLWARPKEEFEDGRFEVLP